MNVLFFIIAGLVPFSFTWLLPYPYNLATHVIVWRLALELYPKYLRWIPAKQVSHTLKDLRQLKKLTTDTLFLDTSIRRVESVKHTKDNDKIELIQQLLTLHEAALLHPERQSDLELQALDIYEQL